MDNNATTSLNVRLIIIHSTRFHSTRIKLPTSKDERRKVQNRSWSICFQVRVDFYTGMLRDFHWLFTKRSHFEENTGWRHYEIHESPALNQQIKLGQCRYKQVFRLFFTVNTSTTSTLIMHMISLMIFKKISNCSAYFRRPPGGLCQAHWRVLHLITQLR